MRLCPTKFQFFDFSIHLVQRQSSLRLYFDIARIAPLCNIMVQAKLGGTLFMVQKEIIDFINHRFHQKDDFPKTRIAGGPFLR